MGLNVALETNRGECLGRVADPTNILHRLLPGHDEKQYQCLRFVDWYGDTWFNRLQIEQFLLEWDMISSKAATAEEIQLLAQIKGLAQRCQKEPHLCLKFYGD